MTPKVSDDFHALVIDFEEATAAFDAGEKSFANHELVSDLDRAIREIETTKLVATTYNGAISALRMASSDLDNFASTEIAKPLVKGALAYFEKLKAESGTAAERAMNMATGLSLARVKKDIEWLAIYDALNTAEEIIAAFCNRPACISDEICTTAAGDYIDTLGEFLVWERSRVVDAMREALKNTRQDPELLNKAILAHDVKYSEFGFKDISAQVASMSARYAEYEARRKRR